MNLTTEQIEKIIKRANQLSGLEFKTHEDADQWLYDNVVDERHECEVQSNGRAGQLVEFGNFWSQGEIVRFSDHWFKSPDTQINHERFVDENGKVIQLYYLVGETEFNAPDGFYYSKQLKKHVPAPIEEETE